MFNNEFAWSYSAASLYEQCPHKYYREKVKKDIKYVQNNAAIRGEEVHKYLEYGVQAGVRHPVEPDYKAVDKLDKWISTIRVVQGKGYRVGCETKMTLNKSLQPTGWFDADAWQRTIVDLWIYYHDKNLLHIFDYKTGKVRVTSQLELTAAIAAYYFADQMKFDKVVCTFLFVDQPPSDGKSLFESHRAEIDVSKKASVIKSWLPVLQSIDDDMSSGEWERKQSWLCRYCDVKDCPFNNKE